MEGFVLGGAEVEAVSVEGGGGGVLVGVSWRMLRGLWKGFGAGLDGEGVRDLADRALVGDR